MRRTLGLVGLVVAIAVVTGSLAAAWYRSVERSEREASRRGTRQIAMLLLHRIDRESRDDLGQVVSDFASVVDGDIVLVLPDRSVIASRRSPIIEPLVEIDEPAPSTVTRRQLTVTGVRYDVVGGATGAGERGYVVQGADGAGSAQLLRPALVGGWVLTVVATAGLAFGIGRIQARRLRRERERERRRTSAIAHELRTPLASVVTSANLLEPHVDALPTSVQRPVQVLIAEVERLRALVEDLLELARLEAGDHEVHVEVLDLHRLVHDVCRSRGWDGAVRVTAEGSIPVEADRLSTSRIILNLVENSFRHGARTVEVRVVPERGTALLEIADDGPGMSPAQLAALLDDGGASDRAGATKGLGLRIAQQNAELQGMRLTVDSTPGEGTTARVRVPMVAAIEVAGSTASSW